MKNPVITDQIHYIGVDDTTIDLFESQYQVPQGVSYNSYVILDDAIAIMDTVDGRATDAWYAKLTEKLVGRTPDYLIISHMEPDHAGSIGKLVEAYPEITLVGNAKTFPMLNAFFSLGERKTLVVKEGDTLELGHHTLQFFMAPMVHWPEVMVTYEQKHHILFSADGFGTFGALSNQQEGKEAWTEEARRYYINIVGKYGAPVQTLLKKAATLDIQMICPLHGPVLTQDLGYYIGKYQTWSTYQPEEKGVLIAYASIHGNTAKAAYKMAELLREAGESRITLADLSRDDMAKTVGEAFRYDRMVLAAASYDGGLFPPMEHFLLKCKSKAYQNRTVALIENGSWAPCAAKKMKEMLEEMKNIQILDPVVTIRSAANAENEEQMKQLAQNLLTI